MQQIKERHRELVRTGKRASPGGAHQENLCPRTGAQENLRPRVGAQLCEGVSSGHQGSVGPLHQQRRAVEQSDCHGLRSLRHCRNGLPGSAAPEDPLSDLTTPPQAAATSLQQRGKNAPNNSSKEIGAMRHWI
jgi:hypothetical protein